MYGSRDVFDYRSIGKRERDPVNILQGYPLQLVISEIVVVIQCKQERECRFTDELLATLTPPHSLFFCRLISLYGLVVTALWAYETM